MRERAAVFGGQVSAGPRPGGGWQVRTVLPFTEDAMSISILLADDQPMLRLGFRLVLDAQQDMQVIGEAGDGAAALRLVQAKHPDVVLMDVRMPGMDGIEATRHIVARAGTHPGAHPHHLRPRRVRLRRRCGPAPAASCSRTSRRTTCCPRIRAVASGDAVVAPAVTRRLLDAFLPHLPDPGTTEAPLPPEVNDLTAREREILIESPRACPTPRSPSASSWPKPPSRPTSAGCSASSACATGSRPSSTPTSTAWSAPSPAPDLRAPAPPDTVSVVAATTRT